MFKSYIVSIIGFLLGVGAIFYAGLYTNNFEPDNVQQTCVFNGKTIEQKLLGKTPEEISEQYLAPVSTKKLKGKGNQISRYENIQIFTRHEKTVVKGMDITFKNGKAQSIKYDEPKKDRDASILNASPLAFMLIDREIMTSGKEVIESQKAEKWQIPLLLVLLILLVNLPFLLTWPLATLIAKKMDDGLAVFLIAVIWLALYWVYLGIAAYTIGSAIVFLALGAFWVLIALRAFYKTVNAPAPAYSGGSYSGSGSGSYSGGNQGSYSGGNSGGSYVSTDVKNHIANLWGLIQLCKLGDIDPKKRIEYVADISSRERIPSSVFQQILTDAQGFSDPRPISGARREEFLNDLAGVLMCDTIFSDTQSGYAFAVSEKYGEDRDDFVGRMITRARVEFDLRFPEDYTAISTDA